MGFFNFGFFGTPEHRVFNYRPRYYDEDKEALKQKFGKVDGTAEKEYTPGSYIRGSFRGGSKTTAGKMSKIQKIIGIVTMILCFVVIILIARYYQLILQAMGL